MKHFFGCFVNSVNMKKWDDHISEKLCNFILVLFDSSLKKTTDQQLKQQQQEQQQQQHQEQNQSLLAKTSNYYQLNYHHQLNNHKLNDFELETLKKHFVQCFLVNGGREMFQAAFTTSSVDPDENYEVFEQIGDAIVGKFLVQYAYMRFPLLRNTRGPGVVTRIKMKYASKIFLSRMAEKMQLERFIRASSRELTLSKKQDLLDDIFESFFGCLEHFLSERCMLGLGKGHEIVFNILKYLFDQEELSLKYEELNDPKTRLKQLFDQFKILLGPRPHYVNFLPSTRTNNKNFLCNPNNNNLAKNNNNNNNSAKIKFTAFPFLQTSLSSSFSASSAKTANSAKTAKSAKLIKLVNNLPDNTVHQCFAPRLYSTTHHLLPHLPCRLSHCFRHQPELFVTKSRIRRMRRRRRKKRRKMMVNQQQQQQQHQQLFQLNQQHLQINQQQQQQQQYSCKQLSSSSSSSFLADLANNSSSSSLAKTSSSSPRLFSVSVSSETEILGQGQGLTKREAEEMASGQALLFLKNKYGLETDVSSKFCTSFRNPMKHF